MRISARLPEPMLDEIAAVGAAARWSQSATIEALVAEALDGRDRAAERGQDAPPPSGRSGEPGSPGRGALRASQGLAAQA